MSDLISRSALIEKIKEAQVKLESNKDSVWERNKPYYKGLAWAHRLILDSESVDAVEVVHGRWEERPVNVGTPTTDLFCSKCNFPSWNRRYKYCPNCGAKMDGGKDNV